jgi:uncharacterized protein YwqG
VDEPQLQPGTEGPNITIRITNPQSKISKRESSTQMTIDFSTPEMKAAWREAQWLVINAEFAGFGLVWVAGDNLAGAKDAMSWLNWILVGAACFSLIGSVARGLSLLGIVASIHRHLAGSLVFIVSAIAFFCGSTLGGAMAWLRANGFQLATQFENITVARGLYILLLIAIGWLTSTALVPLLLNRRSLIAIHVIDVAYRRSYGQKEEAGVLGEDGLPASTTSKREELEAAAQTALLVRRTDLPVPRTHPARSFFGGLPKLPAEFDWPRAYVTSVDEPEPVALTFLAQIDLAELPDFDARPYLPPTGTLYFFCSSVFMGESSPPCRIVFHPDRADQLPERAPPADLMPLAGEDGDYQVKWLDPATDFYSKVEFKYPISFLPFQDFGFKDDPAGGALLIDSLCGALGSGEPRRDDLLMHRRADGFVADEDWPFNWLMIILATRSVLSHVRDDLKRSEETVLMEIEASANSWLERGARMPPLESVDAEGKSAFRAWWADVVRRYEKMEKRVSTYAFLFPRDLGNVINHVIRYATTHDERALAFVPRKYVENLERKNHWIAPNAQRARYRFFSTSIHQIGGYGSSWQNAPAEHCDDVLLLQVQGDPAFLGWHENDGCVLHFWIDPDALSELDFSEVEATLECD